MISFNLTRQVKILVFLFLVFVGLHFAKPFLAPFCIASILAMLFLPLARKLESKGVIRGLSAFICVIILVIALAGIITLISTQVAGLSDDIPKLKDNINNMITKVQDKVSKSLGISPQQQQEMMQQQKGGGAGKAGAIITSIMSSVTGLAVDTVLVFVYIYLLMYLRTHLKNFLLKLADEREKASAIVSKASSVVIKYLGGLAMMIVMLWVMYGIGFLIVGVKNAFFFAILCGLLEIVPFVGNVTGTGITILMTLTNGGSGSMVLGILVTYGVVQFIQTYILEPLVVGSEVNINPLFTVIAIVVGELVWGVPGMILAIPVLGIIKIVCDHVEKLQPVGFLIGGEKKKKDKNLLDKIKGWFHSFSSLALLQYVTLECL
jgi:predicted PurR-regulated permease PerM